MAGIINWNELRKMAMSGLRHGRRDEDPIKAWDERAKKFNERAMRHKKLTELQIAKMHLDPEYSVLDIGAGTGRLSIPIAKKVKKVTAIDQSGGMLALLEENMQKEELDNITCLQKRWEDVVIGRDVEPHDVVIASHSLGMLDLQKALEKIDATAKRYVYILGSAGLDSWMNREDDDAKFWKDIFGQNEHLHGWHWDYILLYNILHDMKIYANVEIEDSKFEHCYEDLEDAVKSWSLMHNIPPDKTDLLKEHLVKILKENGEGTLCYRRKSKNALIWWHKGGETKSESW
ncbi:MAG: class I SAM-dependent methyltransferase [Methanothrix sp.]|jgi:SAM-dependent methyltransferase|uniref:Methyltransferase, putative n=1 Tax=Methanothrix harundinacea TaxID=301375 RepID=A0A124FMD7_9EURY|nr:MAG: Methyltransferase, putative [Methanothrix harundinacea]MCP1393445.1 methyltransferase domain-containing protein [Methanothrix harundinacea]MDD3709495.1 class I SAM-dependent methyltransferase [Methanothrix sp.]MDD5768846.1 class I SAM-dependent methyltransferase [Methanothrix sp.]